MTAWLRGRRNARLDERDRARFEARFGPAYRSLYTLLLESGCHRYLEIDLSRVEFGAAGGDYGLAAHRTRGRYLKALLIVDRQISPGGSLA